VKRLINVESQLKNLGGEMQQIEVTRGMRQTAKDNNKRFLAQGNGQG